MNSLEFDRETDRMARAIMTRNSQIGSALIADLTTKLTLEYIAAVLVVSIERVMWFEPDSVIWAVENLIPADIMQEIHRITSFTLYKQLVQKGYVPGKDLSVDVSGTVLLNNSLKKAA
ncbi:hypothetical protein [Coleofasciculus chthonoplastes]|jgi:tRNA splicing endonuclease|uniref:hypothetical protein n=1 Tax=Coleofasciculus TaxID=669368 RepID=UPI003303C0C9